MTAIKTVLFCHDTFYGRGADNEIYAFGAFPYDLWRDRFLTHCNMMSVLGRDYGSCTGQEDRLTQSSGEKVTHIVLPNINAPLKRLVQGHKTYEVIKRHVQDHDAVIIRGPAEFGMMAAKAARALGKPYAVEMSGCAFDNTWNHGGFIGKLYAPIKYARARHMVAHANQVIYVTQHFLQKRYPAKRAVLTEHASNVDIKASSADILQVRLQKIAKSTANKQPVIFGLIGNYGNHLKGLDLAIKALGRLKIAGYDFQLRILGTGDPLSWSALINEHNLEDYIIFDPPRPNGKPVLQWLDELDLYIQPSRHEGLPRAVIEAMSRGLPCLASRAGGIAELLEAQSLHAIGDHQTLSQQLEAIWRNATLQSDQAARNFEIAKRYSAQKLAPRRHAFWARFFERF